MSVTIQACRGVGVKSAPVSGVFPIGSERIWMPGRGPAEQQPAACAWTGPRIGILGIDDSIVFAAATMGGVRDGIDFFPLSVEYEERLYARGKIPGSFFRREGRPSTDAIPRTRIRDRVFMRASKARAGPALAREFSRATRSSARPRRRS